MCFKSPFWRELFKYFSQLPLTFQIKVFVPFGSAGVEKQKKKWSNDSVLLFSLGSDDGTADQEEPSHQDEATSLAALWGKLKHWAG